MFRIHAENNDRRHILKEIINVQLKELKILDLHANKIESIEFLGIVWMPLLEWIDISTNSTKQGKTQL